MKLERHDPSPVSTARKLINWFVDVDLLHDNDLQRRASMYIFGHIFGPPFGLLIAVYLYIIDPSPGLQVAVIIVLLTTFFLFPFGLRMGVDLKALSFLTIVLLIFLILYASFEYGGASSPFLCWLLAVPLLGLFYFGPSAKLQIVVLTLLGLGICIFWLVGTLGLGFPTHVAIANLRGVGIFSVSCAAGFISMMGRHYANVVAAQQRHLEHEMEKERETERQLVGARDQAEAANRAKSAFLGNVSHELRTPLNAIIGFSELMFNEMSASAGSERYRGYAKDILESGRHLLSLINDVLEISRIEADKIERDQWELVNVGAVFSSVIRVMKPSALDKGLRLYADIASALPYVYGSYRMLRQIVSNLLSNAVNNTPSGGTVTVRAFVGEDQKCHLVVADTGIGMSEEDIRLALTPFGQVNTKINQPNEGTALGLPLAKIMTEIHGGSLRLMSAPGQGTTAEATFLVGSGRENASPSLNPI